MQTVVRDVVKGQVDDDSNNNDGAESCRNGGGHQRVAVDLESGPASSPSRDESAANSRLQNAGWNRWKVVLAGFLLHTTFGAISFGECLKVRQLVQ